jgi:hypothetical protein
LCFFAAALAALCVLPTTHSQDDGDVNDSTVPKTKSIASDGINGTDGINGEQNIKASKDANSGISGETFAAEPNMDMVS